jgi:hypothetical protein
MSTQAMSGVFGSFTAFHNIFLAFGKKHLRELATGAGF